LASRIESASWAAGTLAAAGTAKVGIRLVAGIIEFAAAVGTVSIVAANIVVEAAVDTRSVAASIESIAVEVAAVSTKSGAVGRIDPDTKTTDKMAADRMSLGTRSRMAADKTGLGKKAVGKTPMSRTQSPLPTLIRLLLPEVGLVAG
jgi:hypothetical protein